MLKGNQNFQVRSDDCRGPGQVSISREFEMLPGIEVDLHTTAMYESGESGEVDSKAFNAEHVITHQHIRFQSVN